MAMSRDAKASMIEKIVLPALHPSQAELAICTQSQQPSPAILRVFRALWPAGELANV
jgi:hypothetical protein